jgi:predicted nucleotidyltransferase
VARDWENWLKNSIGPASDTEETDRDRTEKRIRDAILADGRLAGNVRVFVKGSYANGTNVRRDSDVDVAVEWKTWAYITKTNTASDVPWDQLGVTVRDKDLPPSPAEYRRWVEEALIDAFGARCVDTTGNKAIPVVRGSSSLDADVVPCFRHLRYQNPRRNPHAGIRLYPRKGGQVENWPEQNRENGASRTTRTTPVGATRKSSGPSSAWRTTWSKPAASTPRSTATSSNACSTTCPTAGSSQTHTRTPR